MPRLIHLNGLSGIGKSTIARLYADRHPGVLNLDADHIVCLVGGWQDDFWNTVRAARLLAVGMAETHLRAGHDVVMPQLATRAVEIEGFEEAARRSGAEYREIVLTAGKEPALERFVGRAARSGSVQQRQLDDVVARNGGPTLLALIHDQLAEYIPSRPDCAVVDNESLTVEQTYDAVITVLGLRDEGFGCDHDVHD
jgi:predicted kinase